MLRLRFLGAVPLIVGTAGFGQIIVPGTEPPAGGSDGPFNPTCAPTPCNVTVDLSQAVTGVWNMDNSANAGKGVYDPEKWAVVFKYSSVNVPTNVTVKFTNHPSRAPVVWLVSENVTIGGVISLNGNSGHSYYNPPPPSPPTVFAHAEPGPGGFRGGIGRVGSTSSSAGLGVGGGQFSLQSCTPPNTNPNGDGNGGSFGGPGISWSTQCGTTSCSYGSGSAGPTYGSSGLFQLIGGSGGSGNYLGNPSPPNGNAAGGGAGGGAILVAASGTIVLTGRIECNGGSGGSPPGGSCPYFAAGGSGGAIRLVASNVFGTGQLRAEGGTISPGGGNASGGVGRIRVEANDVDKTISASPPYSGVLVEEPVQIFPPSEAPSLVVAEVRYVNPEGSPQAPAPPPDPRSDLANQDADLSIDTLQPATIVIAATNVPASWQVNVRIVPRFGQDTTASASCTSGDDPCTLWEAQATIPRDMVSAVQVRAKFPGT